MKQVLVFVVLITLTLVATSAGCMGLSETTKTDTPEATWETYVAAFNRGDSDTVYSLLSNTAKAEKSKDSVHNTINALVTSSVKYDSYNIVKKDVTGDTATLEVENTFFVQGYHKTSTDTLNFIKEGDGWKLQKFHTPH